MDIPGSATPAPRDAEDAVRAAAATIDGGMRTAASVASYLRSAIRRRGELFRVPDGGDSSPREVAAAADAGEADDEAERQLKAASESDTQSSSEDQSPPLSVSPTAVGRTASSDSLRSPSGPLSVDRHAFDPAASSSSHASRQYEVLLSDRAVNERDALDEDADLKQPLSRMQSGAGDRKIEYVDVLLQTDAHGLGLNVAAGANGASDAVVVQSFRRLDTHDVGPAEASGKIRAGDHLFSVDGERVASIHQLYAKVSGVESGTFLLLRFLRPAAFEEMPVDSTSSAPETSSVEEEECEEKAAPAAILDVEHAVRDNPQVSTLIRDLVATNQRLQEQLLASRLKQDELTIQLDQLYSLYARTQLDGGLAASFSLPKTLRPFAWRNGNRSMALDGSTSGQHPLGVNRSAYSSKVLLEIEDAVGAEYERLRRNFELQYTLDKQQLERRFAEKSDKLKAAMAKKIAMLQAGFEHVAQTSAWRADADAAVARCCSCDLDNDLDTDSSIEEGGCNCRRETRRDRKTQPTYDAEESTSRQKLSRIVDLLDTYRRQRAARIIASGTNGDLDEEKPEQACVVATTSDSDIDIETPIEVSKNQEPETDAAESDPVVS